ncbi:MAG: gliding motility-associated C-terminal domain-containing protein [Haliscomenobacter sp.]|nr:gliding motility-associated C-terminal domain-containing protein [Haliscomenobacter sp.]
MRFEILEDVDPEVFPDNEIIIFTRWGDIVYQARPYNNDWRGINSAGKELPHATYYYILRLDISKGIIIQGDVTILK